MTRWATKPLGDWPLSIIDGDRSGRYPKREEFTDAGVPFLNSTNLNGDRIDTTELNYVSAEKAAEITKGKVRASDIIMTTRGSIGKVALYPGSLPEGLINAQMLIIRADDREMDPRFLFHVLRGSGFQARLHGFSSGSAQPQIPMRDLKQVPLSAPCIRTQRRIASILSAYDDVIEVNTRRVAILEEMARRLFDEWFIRAEKQEAWPEKKVDDIADVYRGRSYKGTELAEAGGLPFVNLKCIARDGGFRPDGIKRYMGQYKESQTVASGDLVIAVTDMTQERRIVGQCGRVPMLDAPYGVVSMDLVKIAPKDHAERDWLYAWLRWSPFPWNVRQYANGTNVLHLSMDRITEYKLARPPTELTHKFSRIVSPNFQLSERLLTQNELLRAARDLLLPKLISGEIDLERAERGVETAAKRAAAE